MLTFEVISACEYGRINNSLGIFGSRQIPFPDLHMKKALITGVTGQDSSYLAEFLWDQGYGVRGVNRRGSLFNTQRFESPEYTADVDGMRTPRLLEAIRLLGGEKTTRLYHRWRAQMCAKVIGIAKELVFDTTKPDGTPRKLLDVSRLRSLGWSSTISLEVGLRDTYKWYLGHAGRRGNS